MGKCIWSRRVTAKHCSLFLTLQCFRLVKEWCSLPYLTDPSVCGRKKGLLKHHGWSTQGKGKCHRSCHATGFWDWHSWSLLLSTSIFLIPRYISTLYLVSYKSLLSFFYVCVKQSELGVQFHLGCTVCVGALIRYLENACKKSKLTSGSQARGSDRCAFSFLGSSKIVLMSCVQRDIRQLTG